MKTTLSVEDQGKIHIIFITMACQKAGTSVRDLWNYELCGQNPGNTLRVCHGTLISTMECANFSTSDAVLVPGKQTHTKPGLRQLHGQGQSDLPPPQQPEAMQNVRHA